MNTREWRNWQTRTFEGRVDLPYGFKSRFSHHKGISLELMPLFFSRLLTIHKIQLSALAFMEEKLKVNYAGMAELADALDSGSSGATRTGSSPATRTKQ